MSETYHIHLSGRVQGVGFRPLICRLASSMHINGRVSNTADGVHVFVNACQEQANLFYLHILQFPPSW